MTNVSLLLLLLLFYGCDCCYNYIYNYVCKSVQKMDNKYHYCIIDPLISTQALIMVAINL